ncbi:restriction endonuclease subunit S [Enterococcus raffinosus]|nr:restriction endonuclease subunit S [Enterococcus raffinosus]MDK7989190.1 restriction endonuclease subunit S [Enterococcus raffinosus]MDT2579181.1 restriction endonuclease subunit S [Enterococcus raffinosus]MDT2591542.1 restriction endonuclease subunit S [Enterococcus raffinosus]
MRKLGEVSDIIAGGDIDSSILKETGAFPVIANAITDDGIVGYYDSKFRVIAPAVTVVGRGVGVGRAQVRYKSFTPVIRLLSVKAKKHDAKFLESIINEYKIIMESTGVPQLTVPQLKQYRLYLTSLAEETQIGNFFTCFDNILALHQRKLDLLNQLKQAYLQKMFPKNGEKVPEIRFADFDEKWEQRKLAGLADFSKGNGYTKNDLTEIGNPIILYGRLYTKYQTIINNVDSFAIEKDNSVISKGNEVIVPASGETSKDISRASVIGKPGIIIGGDLNIIRPKKFIDSVFLALTISNGTQQKEMTKRAQGKSVVHLHNSDLKQVNLLYPELEEQKQIGFFFKQFDNIVDIQQNLITQLNILKSAFLKKMFI